MKRVGGRRRGENHPSAVLTDHEVELLRDLHENHGYGYRRLVQMFGLSKRSIVKICKYITR